MLCYLCAEPVNEEDLCYGCNELICDEHSDAPWGDHEPEDHVDDDSGVE